LGTILALPGGFGGWFDAFEDYQRKSSASFDSFEGSFGAFEIISGNR